MKKYCFFVVLTISLIINANAQVQKVYSSSEIFEQIEKLNFLGTVLYVGAHPDDENTAMISYLSNKTHARVAYLALTRGDGGQNLIGPEIREQLGVIRTQELLAARRIDGGEQFFTRANDFGFSKTPDETFKMWNKNQVLSDVVWIFRKYRPDVIIDRFDHRTKGDTHGHHTASAILSNRAFDLSNKKDEFPEQLKFYDTWQPQKFYMNVSWLQYGHKKKWEHMDKSKFLKIDLGAFLPLKGLSNTEISTTSRSQHRSQGFGVLTKRGADDDYLERIKGNFPKDDNRIFAGIDTTWNRVKGGKEIGQLLQNVQLDFDFKNPSASLPNLIKAYQLIQKIPDKYWREIKLKQIKNIIAACSGLYLQATTKQEMATPNTTINLDIEAVNRSHADIKLKRVAILSSDNQYDFDKTLEQDKDILVTKPFTIPDNASYTTPYWLKQPFTSKMYQVNQQKLRGLAETPTQFVANFQLVINGVPMDFERDVIFKTAKPDQGEVTQPFDIVPEAVVSLKNKTLIFADNQPKKVKVVVKAYKDNMSGYVQMKHPDNWSVSPKKIAVNLSKKGQEKTVEFTITPPKNESETYINPEFVTADKSYDQQLIKISYRHIPTQTILLPAKAKVIRLNIKTIGKNIAYIQGPGDDMPQSLNAIGYNVFELSAKNLSLKDLEKYDAVVIGVRAYNTNKDLALNQDILFKYAENGGTLITQYNNSYNLTTDKVAPYKLTLSHDRVTDEESPVKFLQPKHSILNYPNKITQKDFKGWVQERGLYFPHKWSSKYTPILQMQDQGDKKMKGSLLVAPYGKGYFVYTGLSFFRELPAGVSGAYRLFANILALGNQKN